MASKKRSNTTRGVVERDLPQPGGPWRSLRELGRVFAQSEAALVGVVSCFALYAVSLGRSPIYCLGFALLVVIIFLAWTLFRDWQLRH